MFFAALAAALAVVAPAMGDTDQAGCSATTGVTASPLIGDTAPTCSFEVECTGQAAGCVWVFALDVNGTGLVEGTMTAEVVSPFGTARWAHPDGSDSAAPSCSGAFHCADSSASQGNNTLLAVVGAAGEGAAVRITCSGGGIAVVQSVSCNVAAVEFGPV
ncbi:MAG: hypothetical protein ACRDKG_11205 [Actinomycetota bacterium]